FYRLNVFPIVVPPLRERSEDIPLLVRHFVRKFVERMNRQVNDIPVDLMEALRRHHWPGNIRELENFIERAVIVSNGSVLRAPLDDLLIKSGRNAPPPEANRTLAEAERDHILNVLNEAGWTVAGRRGAAARLCIACSTLTFRLQKLGI